MEKMVLFQNSSLAYYVNIGIDSYLKFRPFYPHFNYNPIAY